MRYGARSGKGRRSQRRGRVVTGRGTGTASRWSSGWPSLGEGRVKTRVGRDLRVAPGDGVGAGADLRWRAVSGEAEGVKDRCLERYG